MIARILRWSANLATVAILVGIGVWNHAQVNQAEKALCSLRGNLEQRVVTSENYLHDVRTGARKLIPGITEADITDGIRNQRQTIEALSNLNCKPLLGGSS